MIDEHGNPKGLLKRGERKNLQADRVILQPGPPHEVEMVRNIFHQFVFELKSRAQIVRELNHKGLVNHYGRPWRQCAIRNLLRNENYIGNNIYNRKAFRFQLKQRDNPPNLWIRAAGVFEAIVEPSLFARAQEIKRNRRHLFVPDGEILARLSSLLKEKGRLSCILLDKADGIPHHSTYVARFGSMGNAYKLIGYDPKGVFNYIDGENSQTATILKLATDIIATVEGAGGYADFDKTTDVLTIDGKLMISIDVARCRHDAGRGLLWTVRRRPNRPGDLIIALRTDQTGRNIIDFLLLPATNFRKGRKEFSEGNRARARLDACRFDTVDALVHSVRRSLISMSPS